MLELTLNGRQFESESKMHTSLLSCLEAEEKGKLKQTSALCRIAANLKVTVKCAHRFYKLFKSKIKREKEGIHKWGPLISNILISQKNCNLGHSADLSFT